MPQDCHPEPKAKDLTRSRRRRFFASAQNDKLGALLDSFTEGYCFQNGKADQKVRLSKWSLQRPQTDACSAILNA